MLKKSDHLRRGFTLVEFLVYMGLLSILLTVMTSIFFSILDVSAEAESISSVEQDGNFILQRFIYDISNAESIALPSSYGVNSSSLQLSINGINYSYSISNGMLQLSN